MIVRDPEQEMVLRIEDDDGFVTEWPWPEKHTLLGHGQFVAIFEAQHDAMRAER